MENIWFYTLSTSAQVLAALAGLFAVFVVWRVQSFEKILSDMRLAIIKIVSYISGNTNNYNRITVEDLYLMSDLEILKKFSELLSIKISEPKRITVLPYNVEGSNLIFYSLDKPTETLYKNNINKKLSALKELRKILIVNFCVISVCLLALNFSNIICSKFLILTIICATVLYCLYLIGNGIYRITIK